MRGDRHHGEHRRQDGPGDRRQSRHWAGAGRGSPEQMRGAGVCGHARAIGAPRRARSPLMLDVTDAAQIRQAAAGVGSLDVLVNNAGIWLFDDLSDRAALERHRAVSFFGAYHVIQAFLPLLVRSAGAIVNNLPLNALAPLPLTPAYSISTAAAFSMTQSLRALLAGRGVRVHAVLTGPTTPT